MLVMKLKPNSRVLSATSTMSRNFIRLFSSQSDGDVPLEKMEIAAEAIIKTGTVVNVVVDKVVVEKTAHIPSVDALKSMEDRITQAINQSKLEMKSDIDKIKLEMKSDIDKIKLEMKSDINQVKSEFHQTQTQSMRWLFGSAFVGGLGLAYRSGALDPTHKNKPSP